MPDPTPPDGPLPDLILACLLPASGSVSAKKLEGSVAPLLRHPVNPGAFTEAVTRLRAAGEITPKGQQLTDAGRTRALAFLGLAALPARTTWAAIKTKYLLARALGVTPDEAGRLGSRDKLAGYLLGRKFGLPVGVGGLKPAMEALVCQLAGHPDCRTYSQLAVKLVSQEVSADLPLTAEGVPTVGLALLLGVTQHDLNGLRTAAIQGAVAAPQAKPGPAAPLDLPAFAARVLAAARSCPTGRFDHTKVFISHVWRHLHADAAIQSPGLDGFKARLAEANQRRLLDLLPADLNQVFELTDLRESATVQYPTTFHFIVTGDAR